MKVQFFDCTKMRHLKALQSQGWIRKFLSLFDKINETFSFPPFFFIISVFNNHKQYNNWGRRAGIVQSLSTERIPVYLHSLLCSYWSSLEKVGLSSGKQWSWTTAKTYSVEVTQCRFLCIAGIKRVNAVVGYVNREWANSIAKCLHLTLIKLPNKILHTVLKWPFLEECWNWRRLRKELQK